MLIIIHSQKTIKNIHNSFIELCSVKLLRKIMVRQITYELSNEIKDGLIKGCIDILHTAESLFQEDDIGEMSSAFSYQSAFNVYVFPH